jgi:hypothetical protein
LLVVRPLCPASPAIKEASGEGGPVSYAEDAANRMSDARSPRTCPIPFSRAPLSTRAREDRR